jgi:hypothetical protein
MAGARQIFVAAARQTAEETRQALAALARARHAEVMAENPKPQRFTRRVDGVIGAPEEAVKLGGVIVYNYQRLEEVVRVAMETLFELSPVLSGEYRLGHTIFVNGAAARNLVEWDGASEIMIANMLPYARKIEVGKMTMIVPGTDRVYEQAAQLLAKRFGNAARIYFDFRGIAQGAALKGKAANKHSMRYPALIIRSR